MYLHFFRLYSQFISQNCIKAKLWEHCAESKPIPSFSILKGFLVFRYHKQSVILICNSSEVLQFIWFQYPLLLLLITYVRIVNACQILICIICLHMRISRYNLILIHHCLFLGLNVAWRILLSHLSRLLHHIPIVHLLLHLIRLILILLLIHVMLLLWSHWLERITKVLECSVVR